MLGCLRMKNLCLHSVHQFISDEASFKNLEGFNELMLDFVVGITHFDYPSLLERIFTLMKEAPVFHSVNTSSVVPRSDL